MKTILKEVENDGQEDKNAKGWECPRCEKVNGPQVKTCDCQKETLGESKTEQKQILFG